MSKNKIRLTWSDVDQAASNLAYVVERDGFDIIIGLSRGGLPLAVKVSNLSKVPFKPVVWQTRDGKVQQKNLLKELGKIYEQSRILIVDDICDSGVTFNGIKEILPNAAYYAMVTKRLDDVTYAEKWIVGDEWIEFPWEYNTLKLEDCE